MLLKDNLKQILEIKLKDIDAYLVDLEIIEKKSIIISIDRFEGVTFKHCSFISKYLEEYFEEDIQDYDLTVCSAGLENPFKVKQQYHKNIGKEVSVLLNNGKKKKGVLLSYDNGLMLEIKRKKKPVEQLLISKNEIKETKLKNKILNKMEIKNLIESFSEFKEVKNIDRETMMNILEDVFKTVLDRKYDEQGNFDVIINVDKGDLEIWKNREVVEDNKVENPIAQISLTDALKIEDDYEVGEEVSEQVSFEEEFGRRQVLSIRQHLMARISDQHRDELMKRYEQRIGDIIHGEVYQIWRNEILLQDDEGNDLSLPRSEQIPKDYFKKGESVRAVIKEINLKNNKANIVVSRTAPEFIERLFEQEVPEVFDGIITIKNVVREPGERAKVAVESYDDRIDPVGACVGMKGSRIHGIVRELRNENIDVVNFTENKQLLITRALSPAKITSVSLNDENMKANVFMDADQVSLAIGRGGHNINLAGKLTGYDIDVYRDENTFEDDVAIEEFKDEIEDWVIDSFKAIGCDTAKSVLDISPDDLVSRTDLEIETVEEVINILRSEFED